MRLQTLLMDRSNEDRYWTYAKVECAECARRGKSQRFIDSIFGRLVVHYHLKRGRVLRNAVGLELVPSKIRAG